MLTGAEVSVGDAEKCPRPQNCKCVSTPFIGFANLLTGYVHMLIEYRYQPSRITKLMLFPQDILLHILENCSVETIAATSMTCKSFNAAANINLRIIEDCSPRGEHFMKKIVFANFTTVGCVGKAHSPFGAKSVVHNTFFLHLFLTNF